MGWHGSGDVITLGAALGPWLAQGSVAVHPAERGPWGSGRTLTVLGSLLSPCSEDPGVDAGRRSAVWALASGCLLWRCWHAGRRQPGGLIRLATEQVPQEAWLWPNTCSHCCAGPCDGPRCPRGRSGVMGTVAGNNTSLFQGWRRTQLHGACRRGRRHGGVRRRTTPPLLLPSCISCMDACPLPRAPGDLQMPCLCPGR